MNALTFIAERRFTRTPFGRTAYLERGSGPSALFLHGFPLSSFQWRGVRIVWGMADTIFTPAGPELLHRTFPGSRGVRPIPGAKLFFPEELPDVIAEEARALWGVAQ